MERAKSRFLVPEVFRGCPKPKLHIYSIYCMFACVCMSVYNANTSPRRWWGVALKKERSPLFPWPQDDRWMAWIMEIYQALEAAALLVSGYRAEILFFLFLGNNVLYITKVLVWQSGVVPESKKVSDPKAGLLYCMFLLSVWLLRPQSKDAQVSWLVYIARQCRRLQLFVYISANTERTCLGSTPLLLSDSLGYALCLRIGGGRMDGRTVALCNFLILLKKRVKVRQQWRSVLWLCCWAFKQWRECERRAPSGLSSGKSCEKYMREQQTNLLAHNGTHVHIEKSASLFYLYIWMTSEQTNNGYDGFPKATNYPLQFCCSIIINNNNNDRFYL